MADFKTLLAVMLTIIKMSNAGVHSISSSTVFGINPDSMYLLPDIEYNSETSSPRPFPRSVSTSTLFFTSEHPKNTTPTTSAPSPINESLPLSISISIQKSYSKSTTSRLPSSTHTSPSTPFSSSSTLVSTPSTSSTTELLPLSGLNSTTSPKYTPRYLSSSTLTTVKSPTTAPTPLHTSKFNLTPDQATVYNLSDILKLLPAEFQLSTSSPSVLSSNLSSSPRSNTIPESTLYLKNDDKINSALLDILSKLSEVSDLE